MPEQNDDPSPFLTLILSSNPPLAFFNKETNISQPKILFEFS